MPEDEEVDNYVDLQTMTNWCSGRNALKNFNGLDAFSKTKRCCKLLKTCEDFISPGEWKYGLYNSSPYKRFSCDCEGRFYGCLKLVARSNVSLENEVAENIGGEYFNTPNAPCFLMCYDILCENGYYDIDNSFHPENKDNEYFCGVWYTAFKW
ncbi:hypothetical protein KM043_011719 [Ampulex compressa]|nr:hypothetical protein KM043_011719 [Ampulex compressa]